MLKYRLLNILFLLLCFSCGKSKVESSVVNTAKLQAGNGGEGVDSSTSAQVAQAAPAAQVIAPLIADCKDEDPEIRKAAIKALCEVVKAAPELAVQVIAPLRDACKE